MADEPLPDRWLARVLRGEEARGLEPAGTWVRRVRAGRLGDLDPDYDAAPARVHDLRPGMVRDTCGMFDAVVVERVDGLWVIR